MGIKINKQNLLDVLYSPYFLAFVISLIIIIFLPNIFSKYKAEQVQSSRSHKPNSIEQYHDLDNNGYSERVIGFPNAVGLAAIQVLDNSGGLIDQWNFKGKFPKIGKRFYCADLNADSLLEIYVFTISNDSLYFHCIEPLKEGRFIFKNKFISLILKYNNQIDLRIGWAEPFDLDGDGFSELIINVHAGFSKQPRGLFAYNAQQDTIIRTPIFGANIIRIIYTDLNKDNKPEIFCSSSTLGNIQDSLGIPFSDYSSWLMGFNEKLEFLFKPIEYDAYPSFISIVEIKSGDKSRVAAFYRNKSKSGISSMITLISEKGKIIRKKLVSEDKIAYNFHPRISIMDYKNTQVIKMTLDTNSIILLDTLLQPIKTISNLSFDRLFFKTDINHDGRDELIYKDLNANIYIADENLEYPVILKTKLSASFMTPYSVSIKKNGDKNPELFIDIDNTVSFYIYNSNPLYYLKYPIWLGIYIIILSVILLIRHIQKLQLQRKMEIENRMNALQLKTIKSQMDPHFMFNALNSISTSILSEQKETAYSYMVKFSSLLRSLFIKADDLAITLQEELAFVENYLELERFRFKDKLSFEIQIEPNVDQSILLPRMFIQLFVENAIKHGLKHKKGKGSIYIKVEQKKEQVYVSIEDDGIGRKAAKQYTGGHGKGLKIINEMISLNFSLSNQRIRYRYEDLYDSNNKPLGTKVWITVYK